VALEDAAAHEDQRHFTSGVAAALWRPTRHRVLSLHDRRKVFDDQRRVPINASCTTKNSNL